LFHPDEEMGEWSFVELVQYSSLLAAGYSIIHNKQVPAFPIAYLAWGFGIGGPFQLLLKIYP